MHLGLIMVFVLLPTCQTLLFKSVSKCIRMNISQFSSKSPLNGVASKHQRVERIIANRGAGSRKQAESLIRRGLVVVNGKVITSRNDKCSTSADVYVDGVCYPAAQHMAIYHKPFGVLSTIGDPRGRPNLKDVINQNPVLKGMHPVGRLDADSTGLLLFSNDGKLTNFLLSPTNKIVREYRAVVVGNVDFEKLRLLLWEGVETTDGKIKAKLLNTSTVSEEQKKSWFPNGIKVYHTEVQPLTAEEQGVEEIAQAGELELTLSGSMLVRQPLSVVNLTVVEGKYRMVRRILHNCGHSVVSLHRTRYGGIKLSSKPKVVESEGEEEDETTTDTVVKEEVQEVELPESAVRYLTAEENGWLQRRIKNK